MMKKYCFKTFFTVLLSMLWSEVAFSDGEDALEMTISGQIETQCDVNFIHGNSMDFSESSHRSLPVEINCNRPLNILVSSENSGLKLLDNVRDVVAPYQVSLRVPALEINQEIESRDLSHPVEIASSGVIPFLTGGVLDVTLQQRLVYAGNYKDVLTIDVVPVINAGL